ncbi:MAG: c-type cytochrome biogenesis protein CcsB [Gammaproteobacteria bacterium]|nr:c-type cytochrome biogenesis protein CcsB [Gammaproteobacteria bacterium]MCL5668723.1 c-type cytochrome biogenesis protein CcsB [Gammaproteobacteria bacterium]
MSTSQETLIKDFGKPSFFGTLTLFDWVWAALALSGAGYVLYRYGAVMEAYETGILIGAAALVVATGCYWKPLRVFALAVAALSLSSVWLYGTQLANAETNFFLQYLLASQSAVMWMSALFILATFAYFISLFARSDYAGQIATALTWSAAASGLIGLLVRWRESYLIHPDVGHIPVSNLYEVFILFMLITSLLYLYYEGRYKTRALGAFVMLVISAALAFLLWLTFARTGGDIQPLVPALKSYWMKIHVPANFIGYGSFSLAATVGIAYLLRERAERVNPQGVFATRLPSLEIMDNLMYRAITLGFGFFTLATVLGALWAAEAWGGYWSWDPKETWALIVLLNNAAWLHFRFTKGWRGTPMAWWAVGGLLVTTFAFLGVNMFLSGLHSYGKL